MKTRRLHVIKTCWLHNFTVDERHYSDVIKDCPVWRGVHDSDIAACSVAGRKHHLDMLVKIVAMVPSHGQQGAWRQNIIRRRSCGKEKCPRLPIIQAFTKNIRRADDARLAQFLSCIAAMDVPVEGS